MDPAEAGLIGSIVAAVLGSATVILTAKFRRRNDRAEERDTDASRDSRYAQNGLASLNAALERAELENVKMLAARAEMTEENESLKRAQHNLEERLENQATLHRRELEELRAAHARELEELRDAVVRLGGHVERTAP